MPVSVVCDPTANAVNAALRDSLGGGSGAGGGSCSSAAAAATAGDAMASGGNTDTDCLQSKLVASAKRVLLTKINYEEVDNYSQSVLETLKSKYTVLKPNYNAGHNGNSNNNGNGNAENGRGVATANCSVANNGNSINGGAADANGTSGAGNPSGKRANPNELPEPKRVLFPREEVRIGWKNPARKWQVGAGMMNVGNTCYLNSTLQALFHVPAMANWLVSDSQHRDQCESADPACIICGMSKTLLASQTSQSAIRPYFVYSKLRMICKHLIMGRQEDAHEFLRYLVEAMEKSYLARFRNFKDLDQYSKETTPLNQILGGYLRSAVRCLACSHVSVTFQHFQDLLLDIRKADSIEEALDGYFSRERLEDMGYKCESCKKKVSATKQFSLERAPIALCIQLKRFSMMGTKLNKQITIKPRLDLTKFASRKTGEQLTYKLSAMVTHLGASQHCGHYTAIGITESGTYYNFDDSYVRPISMQNVCNTNAYIIFYELDSAPLRPVTCTQVSGAETKENYQKLNGYTIGQNSSNGASPQRVIGPHLPPAGLKSYTTTAITNGSPFGNGNGSKLGINRPSGIPTSSSTNSKIMIHFKNNNNNINATVKSNASSSTTTATATSCSQNGTSGNNNNNNNTSSAPLTNGLLTGTGNFQEPAGAKSALAGTPNKGQAAAAANGNGHKSASDNENEVSSTTQAGICTSSKATLPSMPKLFENNAAANTLLTNGSRKAATPALVKSLVPYGYEESEDDEASIGEPKRTKAVAANSSSSSVDQNGKNPLKRRNSTCSSAASSASSSDNNDDDGNDDDQRPTNAVKVKKAGTTSTTAAAATTTNCSSSTNNNNNSNGNHTSTMAASHNPTTAINGTPAQSKANSKQKTDTIDEIFNFHKRNANSTTVTSATATSTTTQSTSLESTKQTLTKKQKSQSQFAVTSTTPMKAKHTAAGGAQMNGDDDDTDAGDDNSHMANGDDDEEPALLTRPAFKRAHSTPPSPPVIKTKTGYWQVTPLQPADTDSSSLPDQKVAAAAAKNPRNPFASSKSASELFTKRPKAGEKRDRVVIGGNGYQRDSASDSAISELLKQSHRGYGASVLTWNGEQTTIEKEVKEEARQQRQRDWEEEQENDMDCGRQKKVKAPASSHTNGGGAASSRAAGYNPFQEQRRWGKQHGSSGGVQRFHSGHFRNQFQRNKFKFQRFNHKYQRPPVHHQSTTGGAFGRRDS